MSKYDNYTIITNIKSFNTLPDTIYIPDILSLIHFVNANHNKNGKKYIILFDEIFTILMRGQSVNNEILAFLAQLRKRGLIFVTTAQQWSEIPISFRKFCRFQVKCSMLILPFTHHCIVVNQVCDGYNSKWDNDQQDFVAPLIQTNVSKGNKNIIELYDTFEVIQTNILKK